MTDQTIAQQETRCGYYFEDLYEGQTFVSAGRTVTESDVVGFAGFSGDFNPIHMDIVAASAGAYGQRVAHGLLGISVATGLIDALGVFRQSMIAMLGIEKWTFEAPMFIGDTIHVEISIAAKRLTSKSDRGVVHRDIKIVNQRGDVVQKGRINVMIRCRERAPMSGT